MKVFISWSGETSRRVAEAFRSWIPSVIQCVKPYVSSEDIQKGANWSANISCELDDSNFGIICLTKENASAPWVHFEAGALGKCFSTARVSPFLFHINQSDVQGPLTQFQSTNFEEKDMMRLLNSINDVCGEGKLENSVLEECFSVWWPKLEEKLNAIEVVSKPDSTKKGVKESEPGKVLEEILDTARTSLRILSDPEKFLPKEYLREYVFNPEYIDRISRRKGISPQHHAIRDLHRTYKALQNLLDVNIRGRQVHILGGIVNDSTGTKKSLQENLIVERAQFNDWHDDLVMLISQLEKPIMYLRERDDF